MGRNAGAWFDMLTDHSYDEDGKASTTAAAVAISVAASGSKQHMILFCQASYSGTTSGLLTITDGTTGATVLAKHMVYDSQPIAMLCKATRGNAITAKLAAGAAGTRGYLNIQGISQQR